jgi:UDP-N-acetyl-D-mannosaminuronic acid dehydrogenase
MQFEKVCVLGLGYIGLPTASTFAAHGMKVTGVDVNPQVLATLCNGEIHIQEPGLRALVQTAIRSGNLALYPTPEQADAYIIAVPTPFYEDKRADLRFVVSAAESIVPHLRPGNLVVLESTSPPRTTTGVVAPILARSGLVPGQDFFLAYSPERVLPGQILRELIENARVIGGVNRASAEAGRDLYSLFVQGEILLTDATTAEMVKLMENTYRDVNIAISNEFARLADRFGVNAWEAIDLANRHPRVNILRPGPGVGGHCISVDPWFLVEAAPDLATLIRTARQVNDAQPRFVVSLVRRALGGHATPGTAIVSQGGLPDPALNGKRIAALGLSYKPDVDDMRESPAIEVALLLKKAGAQVAAYEPNKPAARVPGLALSPTLEEALEEADAILLLVKHTTFKGLDPAKVARLTPARIAIDAVNGWPPETWKAAGFRLYKLGDGIHRL